MRDRVGTTAAPPPKQPELVSEHGAGQRANVKPAFRGHDEPPNPTLRQLGFAGSILDFNDHVQAIADSHQQTFGYDPPPGLTLDIARSGVGLTDYPKLFPAVNKRTYTLDKTVNDFAQDPNALTVRHDGVLVRQYPQLISEHGVGQEPNKQPPGLPQLQKQYPNVQMGMLPVAAAENVYQALDYLNKKGGLQTAITQQGMTVEQFQAEVKRGQGIGPDLAATAEMSANLAERQGAMGAGQIRKAALVGSALTIKDAQTQLNKAMGTSLPETGFFNQDWTVALSNWMKSADYFTKTTQFQAQNAGFGNNVNAYLKAWKGKQYSVQHHGLVGHFLNAMPLQVFGHGFLGGLWEVPKYIAGGGGDPVSTTLHALTRTAGMGLGVVGGTVDQAKADLATGSQFLQSVTIKGKSFDEALKSASKTLSGNPTWLRVFYPDLEAHPKGVVGAIDQLTNLTGDLWLLGKPRFTGELIAPGDLAGARTSTYVNRAGYWAFDYLKRGNTGRAAEMLEGGNGAKRLAAVAAPAVKAGKMTQEQFTEHLAELYATGSTQLMVGGKTFDVTGSTLASLRSKYLPTPGTMGMAWLQSKKFTRDWLDAFDSSAHTIAGSKANALINTVRTAAEHITPASMHYFDENLPGAIRHFIVDNDLGNRALADSYASQATRLQATQNIARLQGLQQKLERLYHAKNPLSKGGVPGEPFEATLGTEAPSIFSFPGGAEADIQGALGNISRATARLNNGLNRFAKYRTRLVLSTGLSLFYKHAVGDFMRFVYGGGISGNAKAAARIDQLAQENPDLERVLGVFLNRAETGETRYTLGRNGTYSVPAFRTGEAYGSRDRMTAAGGSLRNLLLDDALSAYRRSGGSNLDPLVQLVLRNRTYRGMWKSAQKTVPELSAEEYAQKIYERFAHVDEAASAAGIEDVWGKGLAVVRDNRGAGVDQVLGDFVKENRLDFNVPSGRIEAGGFDEVTGRIINFLMRPNKYYRRRFAENVLHNTFDELSKAGFGEREAFQVGTDLASKLVKYHMLDFANRLQVEQDFRWLSWFATKHRLYWKWVINAMARSPGAAAVIGDAQKTLDDRGNLNFDVFGRKLSIPAARLVWVPGREYSEVSPDAQFVWNLVLHTDKGLMPALKDAYASVNGNGNVITRIDEGLVLAVKTAKMLAGQEPSTFSAASNGLSDKEKQRLQRDFNEYTLTYFHDHGHYPTESEVVGHVMWRATAENLWRSALPLPVVPATPDLTDQQKLMREYMMLVDPKQKHQFLDTHPGFSDHFGVWDDPKAFLHNHQMFGQYTSALDAYRSARTDLFNRAKDGGMKPALVLQKRKLDDAFQKTFDKLLVADARYAGIDVQPGEVPGTGKVPLGPWGKLASADPQINPRHILNALFPKLQSSENAKIYGRLQKELKAELALLNTPNYAATYPDPQELKTRKRIILQQLDVFRRYPSDALGQIQQDYQVKYVNPYWQTLDKKLAAIQATPTDQRDLAYAELRAWRDSQDHEVKVNGITFPSPIRMAWATLDSNTRNSRLRYFAAKTWADLTNYEKELLGIKRDNQIAKGWQTFQETYNQAADKVHLQGGSIPSGYKLELAKWVDRYHAPGFLKDFFFSQKPLYERMDLMSVKQDSKFQPQWADLLDVAKTYGRYLKSGDYSATSVKATWREYLKSPGFQQWFGSTPPGFRVELKDYGPNFLNLLIG